MHVFAGFESDVNGFYGRRFRRGMPGSGAGCPFNADVCAILEDLNPVMRELAERRTVEAGGPGRDAGGSVWESCAGITPSPRLP